MEIKIPFKTPTVNTMYATFRGHRVKSKLSRELSKEVEAIVDSLNLKPLTGELSIDIEIHSKWYNKDKTIKKRDVANLEKFITDSIFSALPGMDDKQIFELSIKKIPDEEEFSIVTIKKIE